MSAEPSRPWWATPDDSDRLDGRDPVDAHRAGRRGDGDPGTRESSRPAGEAADGHDPDVCGVCPWCAGLRLLAASHPEAVIHLTEAARHLSQAVRSLVAEVQRADDAAAPEDGTDDGDAPFERIDLD